MVRLAGVQIVDVRCMGSDQKHLRCRRRPGRGAGGGTLRAVWFGGGEHAGALVSGRRVDLAVEPRLNRSQGTEQVEGYVRDVRLTDARIDRRSGPAGDARLRAMATPQSGGALGG